MPPFKVEFAAKLTIPSPVVETCIPPRPLDASIVELLARLNVTLVFKATESTAIPIELPPEYGKPLTLIFP